MYFMDSYESKLPAYSKDSDQTAETVITIFLLDITNMAHTNLLMDFPTYVTAPH